jgi:hypothetical protein
MMKSPSSTKKITKALASHPGLSAPRGSKILTPASLASLSASASTKNARIATPFGSIPPRPQRRLDVSASAAAAESSTSSTTSSSGPALSSLDLLPIIDQQGYIAPPIPEGASAAVLAIYSENRTLQLVAFSADPRRSLTTLVGRRPDKAYHYRAAFFPSVDQEGMVALREAWFKENAGAPVGNKLALEKDAWTQPVSAGAISERGRRAAAEGQAAELLKLLRTRGCKEDLVPDEALLDAGKVDFLPAIESTEEDRAKAKQASDDRAAAARIVKLPKGITPPLAECTISRAFPTNGGVMFDVTLAHDSSETEHRVIVGKRFYEPFPGKTAEDALDAVLSFLLWTQTDRHTDGLLLSSQFNSNYFAAAELESMWGDAFEEHLEDAGLRESSKGDEKQKREGIYSTEVWRFARTHDYKDDGVAVPTSDPLWV